MIRLLDQDFRKVVAHTATGTRNENARLGHYLTYSLLH
jgi:hypothetical protein